LKSLLLAVVWALAAGPATAGVGDAFFATPLPTRPGQLPPPDGPLAAPVITPLGITKHGASRFEVTPAGWDRDPFFTRDPGRYMANGPDNPIAATADTFGWVSVEFLYWATQGPTAPPLVTTGPAALGPGVAGSIGQPSTQVLLGGERMLNGLRPGLRIEAGLWSDETGRWALSHQFLYLGSRSERLVGGSDGTNVVAMPQVFPLVSPTAVFPMYVGFPGLDRGTVTASAQTNLIGGNTNLRRALRAGDAFRLEVLGGYRYVHLGDSISDSFDIVPTPTPGAVFLPGGPGPRVMGEDSVRTRNNFHGGQLGLSATGRVGRLTFETTAMVALGVNASELDQSRTRTIGLGAIPGAGLGGPPVFPVQNLLLPDKSAYHNSTDYFAVVPEFGFKFGWQPVDHLRLTAGYNVLYLSRVRRAQELYTLGPTVRDDTTDFWAQGFTLGAELRY
jgi:hypothetical protein